MIGGALGQMLRPARALFERGLAAVLILAAIALLVLSKVDVRFGAWLGASVGDAALPVLAVLDAPALLLRRELDQLGSLLAVHDENRRLREENRQLLAWQAEAGRLAVQNAALRHMLAMPAQEKDLARTTARVMADGGGPFVHTLLIDAGRERGVREGMAVVAPEGLVGRVVQTGRTTARVLLVTDLNSKIPVVIDRSLDRAILEGDNSARPALRFTPLVAGFAAGDRVLTSGEGGLLPPGLLVGRISAVTPGRTVVQPLVDWAHLDYVAVLRLGAGEGGPLDPPGGEAGAS